jgi:hypothetical protein
VLPKFPSGLTPAEDAKSFEHLLRSKSDKYVYLVIIVLVLENKRITTKKESLSEGTNMMNKKFISIRSQHLDKQPEHVSLLTNSCPACQVNSMST